MFVEDYSAGRDVWTRALPALATLFVLSLLGVSIKADDPLGTVLSIGVVVAFAIGYVVWNRRRGARPWQLPDHVTPTWLALFVAVPAVLAFAFDRTLAGFLQALLGPLALLGIVYVVARYALVALTAWALRWTFDQLGDVVQLVTRVLPLMLLVVTFLYMSPGVWQAMGSSTGWTVAAALLVLTAVGVLFIVTRARRELAKVDQSTDRAGVVSAAAGTPLDDQVEDLPDLDLVVPMASRQRANMLLVMVVAQLVQVSLIGFVVWAFFVLFGFAAIRLPVQTLWLSGLSDPGILGPVVDGHAVTHASMRVAAFLEGSRRSTRPSTPRPTGSTASTSPSASPSTSSGRSPCAGPTSRSGGSGASSRRSRSSRRLRASDLRRCRCDGPGPHLGATPWR